MLKKIMTDVCNIDATKVVSVHPMLDECTEAKMTRY